MKTINRSECFTLNGAIAASSMYVTRNPESKSPQYVSSSHKTLKAAQAYAKANTWEFKGQKSVREIYEVIG